MSLTREDWHNRFLQQAQWTKGFREFIFPRIGIKEANRILDIGCGTGALMEEITAPNQGLAVGGDLNLGHLRWAMRNSPGGIYFCGDGHSLPFPAQTFQTSLNHFLLLWVEEPIRVVREMKRVTKQDGYVLALAEPDYGGRLDYPPPLDKIKARQISSLKRQGADPKIGRKLKNIFQEAGIQETTIGVFAAQWKTPPSREDWEMEWKILAHDLQVEMLPGDIQNLKKSDWEAWQTGQRTLYIPTFYAWGRV